MLVTCRFKLKPTEAQYVQLSRFCELQRLLYNGALQERTEAWSKSGVSISKVDQSRSLTEIRKFDEVYRDMPVCMSRWSIARVDDAMQGFFGRIKRGTKAGFPRYRSKGRWRSFGFVQWDGIRFDGDRLHIKSLVGALRLNMHRPLPADSPIKACTFTKAGLHWWVSLSVETAAVEVHSSPGSAIGIDVGLLHQAVTSDGEFFPNVRARSRRAKELRIAARALARCKRGSKRRKKMRERLARIHRRVANFRSDHLHKISADLTKRYAFIAVEKLNLKNMTRSARGSADEPGKNVRQKAGLNRSMADAAPGRLIALLTWKAEKAAGIVVKVDPRNTSQDCSSCGVKVVKTLAERMHRCACGADLDRDVNAAKNILQRAILAHRRGRPPGDANVGPEPMRRLGITVAEAA